ncbi:MAG: PAS domain-containing protein, partial [Desulfobulbaceae bacterium]|nr:PAS domain-containing protein [Desulfobulbaceae bacterium]
MKAKNNTVITVSIVLLVLSGYFLANGIYQQNKILDETLRNEEKHIDTIIGSILKYSLAPYLTRIQHIELAHPDIIKAFANRDREKLYATASHEFHVLQQENEYFHAMDFTLPDGTVFMRVQRPDLHGDNINKSRKIVQHVQLTQKTAAGFDIGKHGAIYWIAQPLQIDGKQIGTMEFGISINLFTDAIRQRLHNEVTIAIKSSEWEKATFGTQNIHKIGDYYLMTEGRNLYNKFPANFDFDAKHHQAVIDNIDNLVHSRANIRDYSGNPIGKIVVLQDISKEIASKKNFVIQSILIASFLVGSALLIIYLTIHHLVGKLEKYADKNRQANEELLSNHDELERLIVNRTSELAQANAVLHQEITDRSKAEKTNLDQREFLQNIIESLTNPFYVFDAETYEITLANKAAYALTDRPKEGLTCHAMTHNSDTPCSGDEHICALAEVKMTKRPVRVEHIHCNSAGDGRYYEVYAYPIFDRDGKITQIIEYNIDITERKKIEEEKSKIWSQLLQSQKMKQWA